MRIAAYNVNGINGRLANLLEWLEETTPDIVYLQDLKAPDDIFPASAILAAGYRAVWHGQKIWNGVAILSSRAGSAHCELFTPMSGSPRRRLDARLIGWPALQGPDELDLVL